MDTTNTNTNIQNTNIQNQKTLSTMKNLISLFPAVTNSSNKIADLTIESALNTIQSGTLTYGKVVLNTKALVEAARTAGKGSARYISIKKYSIPGVTWASNFSTGRNKETGYTFSNAIYFDLDGVDADLEQVKAELAAIPCVKAVWLSLSATGLGGIIYAAGEDTGYFRAFCAKVEELGYEIDPSVKDCTSRMNVFSYDSNIIIKSDSDVEVLTETLENKLQSATTKICTNNKNNIQNFVEVHSDVKAHRIAYKYTNKRFSYVTGQKCAFTTAYAGLCNQLGLDFNVMVNEMSKMHPEFNVRRAQDVYNRYSYQFGTKSMNPVSYAKVAEKADYTIKTGERLSYVGLTINDIANKMLVSPTGSGKTHFVVESLDCKKIVVVPSQPLTTELAAKYEGVAFNQFNKYVTSDDKRIFVTYASYKALTEMIDVSGYRIFLDESHVFTTNASRSFMLQQLNDTVDALENGTQLSVSLLTATPVSNAHPYFKQFDTVIVKEETPKTKELMTVRTADRAKLLQSVFAKAKAQGKFVSVLLNNTKDTLDSYLNALAAYNIQVFNAGLKGEQYFTELITTGNIDANVDGFVQTTVLKEGNSFKFNTPKDVILVVLGKFGAEEIEQTANRFRNATKITAIIARGADYETNDVIFSSADEEALVLEAAEANVKYFNALNITDNQYSVKMTKNLNAVAETYTKQLQDGTYDVDYLLISNLVYEAEKTAAWIDNDFFVAKMSQYNWSNAGIKDFADTLTEDERTALKAANDTSKANRAAVAATIVAKIQSEGLEANKTKVDDQNISLIEADIRYKLDYIYKYEKDETSVFNTYAIVAETSHTWNQFERQVSIARAKTDDSIKGRDDRNLIDAIYNEFKVGETLKNEEILERLTKVVTDTNKYKSFDKLTAKKANKMLRWFFGVQDVVAKVNGKSERSYKITSDNPCPITIDTNDFVDSLNNVHTMKIGKRTVNYNVGLFA